MLHLGPYMPHTVSNIDARCDQNVCQQSAISCVLLQSVVANVIACNSLTQHQPNFLGAAVLTTSVESRML